MNADLFALVKAHAWVPLAALVIGVIVRLLKSDTKIPIDVPPRLRVWLALGLGVASAALEAVAAGVPWKEAAIGGLTATALAVLGHSAVIDSMRNGKEFVVPGLTLAGVPPGPGKPPSIAPPTGQSIAPVVIPIDPPSGRVLSNLARPADPDDVPPPPPPKAA